MNEVLEKDTLPVRESGPVAVGVSPKEHIFRGLRSMAGPGLSVRDTQFLSQREADCPGRGNKARAPSMEREGSKAAQRRRHQLGCYAGKAPARGFLFGNLCIHESKKNILIRAIAKPRGNGCLLRLKVSF